MHMKLILNLASKISYIKKDNIKFLTLPEIISYNKLGNHAVSVFWFVWDFLIVIRNVRALKVVHKWHDITLILISVAISIDCNHVTIPLSEYTKYLWYLTPICTGCHSRHFYHGVIYLSD